MDTPLASRQRPARWARGANAVGWLAERTLAAQFNRDQFPIIDHYTYCFAGDGCLMEASVMRCVHWLVRWGWES